MERLNFNHLFYFYIVAKEGSVKAASEKLHISSPTISDQIKLLEEHFGCPLFERKHKSMALNREGKLALDYCEQLFELSQTLTTRLRNRTDVPKRSIDIGVTHFMSQYFIYDWILPVLRAKEIVVNVREDERHYLLADLEEDRIDIVFTDNKESISANIDAYRVGLNRTFAVAHKKYAHAKVGFPASLGGLPYFGHTSESFLKYEIKLFFAKHGISPQKVGEADDVDLHQLVTREGIAFTIVPEIAKKRFQQHRDVVALGELEELQTSVWGLIKRTNQGHAQKLLVETMSRLEAGRKKRTKA